MVYLLIVSELLSETVHTKILPLELRQAAKLFLEQKVNAPLDLLEKNYQAV